jgi:pilus assembly protein CpaF
VITPELVSRLSLAASGEVGVVEAELESTGEGLDELARELLVGRVVDEELGRVNLERLRAGESVVGDEERRLARALVLAELYGLRGRIGALFRDDSWDELNINSGSTAWISFGDGRKVLVTPALFAGDEEARDWFKTTARRGSDIGEFEFSALKPRLSMQMPDGSRLHALWGGRGSGGLGPHPVGSIRRQRVMRYRLGDLRLGSAEVEACLVAMVKAKRTFLVTGDTGSGKTTTARSLAHEADFHERIVTLESIPELFLEDFPERHGDVVALEARAANVEGEGAHSLADLVEDTLRMHPDRIWMGEILGPTEAPALLNALAGGHRGSCATLHGTSARGSLLRLQSLCLQADLSAEAANSLIASSVDFVVHLGCDKVVERGGEVVRYRRYVAEVVEVFGYDGGQIQVNEVFAPGPDGRARPAYAMEAGNAAALAAHGYQHQANFG